MNAYSEKKRLLVKRDCIIKNKAHVKRNSVLKSIFHLGHIL